MAAVEPEFYQPYRQRIIACPVADPTSPRVAASTAGIIGPTQNTQSQTMGSPIIEEADMGLSVTTFDMMAVPRDSTITWSEVLRSDALFLFLAYSMLGSGSDTTASSGSTTLGALMTLADTALTVAGANPSGFPLYGNFAIQIGTEQMLVFGDHHTAVWQVVRGIRGTTIATHASSDAVTLVGAKNHVGHVTGGLPRPWSIWHDTGAIDPTNLWPAEYLRYDYALLSTLNIAWSPTQAVMGDCSMDAFPGKIVRADGLGTAGAPTNYPTVSTKTSGDGARVYDGLYQFMSQAGAIYPVGDVVSGSLQLSRQASSVKVASSPDPTDIAGAALSLSGTFEIVYRGSKAGSVYADWLTWKKQQGASGHHNVTWVPPDGTAVTIAFQEMMFTDCRPVRAGENTVHVTASFQADNPLAQANSWGGVGGAWDGIAGAPSLLYVNSGVARKYDGSA